MYIIFVVFSLVFKLMEAVEMSDISLNSTYYQKYSCADGSGVSFNSVTIEYWDSSSDETRSAALISVVITLCFFLVGLPSNLVIIVSILRQHLYGQPTYILLLNLAIADLLLCVLVMPFTIISGFAGEFMFGRNDYVRCRICQLGIFFTVLALVTIHILALLSLDRLIYIKYPLKYHEVMTTRRVTVIMICVWAWSIFISTFPLFGFGDLAYSPSISICVVKFTEETKLTKNIYYPVFLAIVSLILLSVLFACNLWVGCIVQKHIRKIYSIKKNISSSEREFIREIKDKLDKTKYLKQLQFIKVFGAILSANVVTWIPLIVRVFYSAIAQRNTPAWLMVLVYISVISVAVIHPVIQASLVPELRKYFVRFKTMFLRYCGKLKPEKEVDRIHRSDRNPKCLECNCLFFFSLTFVPEFDDFVMEDSSLQL